MSKFMFDISKESFEESVMDWKSWKNMLHRSTGNLEIIQQKQHLCYAWQYCCQFLFSFIEKLLRIYTFFTNSATGEKKSASFEVRILRNEWTNRKKNVYPLKIPGGWNVEMFENVHIKTVYINGQNRILRSNF